jgi:hypothetical protein
VVLLLSRGGGGGVADSASVHGVARSRSMLARCLAAYSFDISVATGALMKSGSPR